ncbi:EF-hand domain-containing protein [Novosphingobium sp. FGD1]|uniref:EF-hand domain-containing protein n=1 Tax=Novosphingobium silvae TaxID=2692619 RepID=A0A7X4GDT8_9SPHN|nr:EF-hand domain-containing protein [Novosphingobium silvae]
MIALLGGLSSLGNPQAASAKNASQAQAMFVSPMGEPFRPSPDSTERPFMMWFTAADLDHNGRLDSAEFGADALRFYKVLNVDGDEEIGPAEITRYEEEIVPEIRDPLRGRSIPRPGMPAGKGKMGGGGLGGMGSMGGGGAGGMGSMRGMGARGDIADKIAKAQKMAANRPQGLELYGLLPIPQPVASADTNFNRGITEAEFLKAAQQRFQYLDQDQDGGFVAEEALQIIKARRRRR